jgi:hypothetical protein
MGRPKGSKNKLKEKLISRKLPSVTPAYVLKMNVKEAESSVREEPKNVATKSVSKMGKCKSCGLFDAHSEVDRLCYNCHKEVEGFEFDSESKRWIKKRRK